MERITNNFSRSDESVVLVNPHGRQTGTGEKYRIHRSGLLHRAFSVFVFNRRGELLLQRRSPHKYHSGGLWSNTCCSHPKPGENTKKAVVRRLREEMGFTCGVEEVFHFIYKVKLDNNFYEHEYDHVFVGIYEGEAHANPQEVSEWKWEPLQEIARDIRMNPEFYTIWFKIAFPKISAWALCHPQMCGTA